MSLWRWQCGRDFNIHIQCTRGTKIDIQRYAPHSLPLIPSLILSLILLYSSLHSPLHSLPISSWSWCCVWWIPFSQRKQSITNFENVDLRKTILGQHIIGYIYTIQCANFPQGIASLLSLPSHQQKKRKQVCYLVTSQAYLPASLKQRCFFKFIDPYATDFDAVWWGFSWRWSWGCPVGGDWAGPLIQIKYKYLRT